MNSTASGAQDADPSTPTLTVVTVTYSPGEHLRVFLSSLTEATGRRVRVFMADNGSTDGAPERAAEEFPFARLIRTGGNIGYGGAINRAVEELGPVPAPAPPGGRAPDAGDFIVVANPDVRWGRGSLDALLDAAGRWPRAGSLGPVVLEPDGTVYPSARAVPGLLGGAGHALLGKVWPSNRWTRAYLQDADAGSAEERPVGWLSGSCLLLRRSAFESVGGFDSRYFMYMEDVDLGDRLGRAGWQNIYVPGAAVTHAKGHAAGRHPETMLPAHHRSAYRFQADRHPHWWQAPVRGALWAGLRVRSRIAVASARAGAGDAAGPGRGGGAGEGVGHGMGRTRDTVGGREGAAREGADR